MNINQIERKYAVGIVTNGLTIQQSIQALEKADFPVHKISIIAKEFKENSNSGEQRDSSNYVGQSTNKGALTGLVIGSIAGILIGTGAVAIPLIGPIMLAEAITTALTTTLVGSGIGIVSGGICGSLVGLVTSDQDDILSSQQWQHGDCLVMVEGTEEDLQQINSILGQQGIEPWKTYRSLPSSDFSAIAPQPPQLKAAAT